jgi:hypothetical protein
MNEAVIVAIQKALETPELAPGVYPVDTTVTLRVQGTVKKGEDTLFTPTPELLTLSSLAILLEKSGFTRERSSQLLIESMKEAHELGKNPSEAINERINDVNAAIARVREITAALPKKTRSGRTTVNATVEVLETIRVAA